MNSYDGVSSFPVLVESIFLTSLSGSGWRAGGGCGNVFSFVCFYRVFCVTLLCLCVCVSTSRLISRS